MMNDEPGNTESGMKDGRGGRFAEQRDILDALQGGINGRITDILTLPGLPG